MLGVFSRRFVSAVISKKEVGSRESPCESHGDNEIALCHVKIDDGRLLPARKRLLTVYVKSLTNLGGRVRFYEGLVVNVKRL